MAKDNFNWMSEKDAAEKLGYKVESLRILARNEKRKTLPIRSTKINRKTILYSGTDIDNYINQKAIA